ncbi:substrate-binding domain-containing protein [Ectopseudomonas oleovorans]|uniref:substrate-binding domain-containing protein n=1 Tax=Ectopseudomonas oleovorans TaxID=301 RepID=UPI0030B9AD05
MLERLGDAIGRFRRRNQAVQIELLSAMPAELERRLLQNQLQLAIGYFSGSQTALDYRPLFAERQRLYCGRQHPLFARETVAASGLEDGDRVLPPTASAPPASPGSPASAARAASRSRAAWPSSSPAPTWVTCPSISPRPGWRAAACARCPASGISPCSFVWPTIAAIPPARRRRPSPTICWTRSASDEARALHLLKHPGSIVVVPSSPQLLEFI